MKMSSIYSVNDSGENPRVRFLEPGVDHKFRGSEQVDHTVRQTLLTQNNIQLVLRGDLFQDFQFTHPHQNRVILQ